MFWISLFLSLSLYIYIYVYIYNDEVIEFDLTNEGTTTVCKHDNDHTVSKVYNFTRETEVVRDEHGKLFIS